MEKILTSTLVITLLALFTPDLLFPQITDTTQNFPQEQQQIRLNTFLESSKVPLNRPVHFHIELSWEGSLSRYQIEPVSQPILTNLLLEGSGSENRLEPLGNGKFRAIKSIIYRFKPLEIGMAYIDGLTVKYTDTVSKTEDRLTSQRVMVEIVEPVPEPGEGGLKPVIYISIFIIFFGILGYSILLYFRKKRQAQQAETPVIPLEELYLNRLSQEVDPRSTNLGEMTGRLSKVFREYFSEAFHIHARESSTAEIIDQLQTVQLEETERANLTSLLQKMDMLKFTGKNIDAADFTNIYGGIEAFLLKRKQNEQTVHDEIRRMHER
ncbi:MAG: hypothetical protein Kow0042_30060 [Calditrichia bacterium]